MKPAIFLDRDGTLIEHVHYLADPDDVALIPGAARVIREWRQAGFACVVVTNQSAVERGIITVDRLGGIHDTLADQLAAEGTELDGIYYCPLAPKVKDQRLIEHPDRKPGPGMLQKAARELSLDLSQSWMIGDSLSDVLAGRNAGCRATILVRSGYGETHEHETDSFDFIAADIVEAAEIIRSHSNSKSHTAQSAAAPQEGNVE